MVAFVLLDGFEGDEPVLPDLHDRQNGPGVSVGGRATYAPAFRQVWPCAQIFCSLTWCV